MERHAVISPCGRYRYQLARFWEREPPLVFIMLNPSTADAYKDDATIRVCMGRAHRMGCGGVVVVNLFAYRATQPHEMLIAADPVGPENEQHIVRTLESKPHMVIAAWGIGGNHFGRAAAMLRTCRAHNTPLYHLGLTKDGHPRHPLRIPYAREPEFWT